MPGPVLFTNGEIAPMVYISKGFRISFGSSPNLDASYIRKERPYNYPHYDEDGKPHYDEYGHVPQPFYGRP